MSRVINTEGKGKRRNQLMRTGAELLRHLSQKREVDSESKDMLAHLALTLKDIADGVDETVEPWEKRNYWVKAEEFRATWRWTVAMGSELEAMILKENWAQLAELMVKLMPYFADIKITRLTRDSSEWLGAYERLLDERGKLP